MKKNRAKSLGRPRGLGSFSFKNMNIQQAAATLCAYFGGLGYDPVLTGRACASVYSRGSIKPTSLDFVVEEYNIESMKKAMEDIGFRGDGLRSFVSPACPYEITFVPSPVMVGDAVVEDVRLMRTAKGPLKLLTATDCVRQRLSMYYRWGDQEAFGDAIKVARQHKIDMDLLRRWSEWEWAGDMFEEFLKSLCVSQK